jgi:DNA-binding MarR family transcriptional regulator
MSRSGRENVDPDRMESSLRPPARRNIGSEIRAQSGQQASTRDSGNQAKDREIHDGPSRGRGPFLSQSDLKTLTHIGTFRALELTDLARYRYKSDLIQTRKQLDNLCRAGLVRSRTSYPERIIYLTLTPAGHRLLAENPERQDSQQKLYHGFVKTREARHDAALYRLYQQEITRIEQMGGRVRRVILDFELKHSLNRRLAKLNSLSRAEQVEEKGKIAQEHGLRMVKGKIPLPDLRLEYEGPDQQLSKVDLELVTGHYHRGNLAAKAKAGFAMYALPEDAARLRPAMQDPEIMQDILSL